MSEIVPGYPERILPKDEEAAKELKKRTPPTFTTSAQPSSTTSTKSSTPAVAAAYGWPSDLSDDEILTRLFELSQSRAALAKGATLRSVTPWLSPVLAGRAGQRRAKG